MIKPGEPWGRPTPEQAQVEITGDDAALAAAVPDDGSSPLVRFHPRGSALARAVGLGDRSAADLPAEPEMAGTRGIALPIDAIATAWGTAVNAVVIGVSPYRLRAYHRRAPMTVTVDGRALFTGRATTVVIANGQFIDGADVVPRGHPGDGKLEIQVYALAPGERAAMRRRLPAGNHLPHPRIVVGAGRVVEFTGGSGRRQLILDGRTMDPVNELEASIIPRALQLLI